MRRRPNGRLDRDEPPVEIFAERLTAVGYEGAVTAGLADLVELGLGVDLGLEAAAADLAAFAGLRVESDVDDEPPQTSRAVALGCSGGAHDRFLSRAASSSANSVRVMCPQRACAARESGSAIEPKRSS